MLPITDDGINVSYVTTKFQLVDIFTKGLSSREFSFLKSNLSIRSPPV